jgi:hypothetical protein
LDDMCITMLLIVATISVDSVVAVIIVAINLDEIAIVTARILLTFIVMYVVAVAAVVNT